MEADLVAVGDQQSRRPYRYWPIDDIIRTVGIYPLVRRVAVAAVVPQTPEIPDRPHEAQRLQRREPVPVGLEAEYHRLRTGRRRGLGQGPLDLGVRPFPRLMEIGGDVEALAEIGERPAAGEVDGESHRLADGHRPRAD